MGSRDQGYTKGRESLSLTGRTRIVGVCVFLEWFGKRALGLEQGRTYAPSPMACLPLRPGQLTREGCVRWFHGSAP